MENSNQNLFTYTNADEVELLINGKSLGVQKNNRDSINRRNIIYWQNVPYGKGGTITAIARNNGKEATRHTLETTGKPVALKMEVENANWKSGGMDLQYLRVYAIDSKGRVVPDAEGEVEFDISGPAKLIAIDNGDHLSDELFDGVRKKLYKGFAMAILRSDRKAGEVKIKATVKGWKPVERIITTK